MFELKPPGNCYPALPFAATPAPIGGLGKLSSPQPVTPMSDILLVDC